MLKDVGKGHTRARKGGGREKNADGLASARTGVLLLLIEGNARLTRRRRVLRCQLIGQCHEHLLNSCTSGLTSVILTDEAATHLLLSWQTSRTGVPIPLERTSALVPWRLLAGLPSLPCCLLGIELGSRSVFW
jgi:hypothetical protein